MERKNDFLGQSKRNKQPTGNEGADVHKRKREEEEAV
jgi:hypothetical protein